MKSVSLAAIASLLVSCLAFTTTATASSSGIGVDFNNTGGTLSGTNAGLSLSGSTLIGITGLNGGGPITGPDLGSVQLTTGALTSGSLVAGGTFAGGGTFIITGNGSNGIPSGVLFSGTFSGPVLWTRSDGTYNLHGSVTGTFIGGVSITQGSGTTQLTMFTGPQGFTGSVGVSGGSSTFTSSGVSVPEPSFLALLLTGSLSMLGTLWGKLLVR